MVIDMGHWTKVIRKILLLILTGIFVYLAFKLAVFYMPFLIAFVLSLMIEPRNSLFNAKNTIKKKNKCYTYFSTCYVYYNRIFSMGNCKFNFRIF